ncbi:MAG: penicillin-binding protein 2 [Holosporaceae bacterium]|jgi:cell division protein FtsI (penicillin-binding protein 3)|nr:penicillin-binding protein 2 [Holosporaceae bacterium]
MYSRRGSNFYSLSTRALKVAKQRALFAASVFFLLFSLLIFRLAQIMIFDVRGGENPSGQNAPTFISRADIVDRNGVIVATSLPTTSLYACPHEIINLKESVEKIANVFSEINKDDLTKKLSSSKKFIWIKRHLSPSQEQAVLNQGIPGMHLLRTERRVYPDKNLLAHVLGGTDVDNVGISGIEKVFDQTLRESANPVVLSIDTKVQHAVRDELQKGIKEFSALGGAAIVMEIATGSIIALVSLPDFDPNKNSDPEAKERFNMVTSSAIEPGSSAKIFNTAMALEYGVVTPFTKFDARFPLKVGKYTIHDFRGKGMFLSVEEIMKYSSNIGSARIAMKVGPAAQKKFFKRIGLLDMVSCELSETQRPLYPSYWGELNSITISFGHGIAFSPLHLITVASGILNNGVLNTPTLLKRQSIPGKKILSAKTSSKMKALMRINVLEGTNRLAEVGGYLVGGKSGTAEKQKGGRYLKNVNYNGFMGAFPMTDPKYAVYVLLDDPKATVKTHGYRASGWNTTPTAGNVIRRIGPILGVSVFNGPEPDWHNILRKIK